MNTLVPQTRKLEKSCADCRFAESFVPQGQIMPQLVCKRFPPVVSMFMAPAPNGQGMAIQGAANQPVVNAQTFCHEFQSKTPLVEAI